MFTNCPCVDLAKGICVTKMHHQDDGCSLKQIETEAIEVFLRSTRQLEMKNGCRLWVDENDIIRPYINGFCDETLIDGICSFMNWMLFVDDRDE